jgi:ATP-dependent RNA helicase RhlE
LTDLNTQTDTAQHTAPMAPVDLDTPVAAPAINGFAALGLMEPIVRAVAAEGYTTPSPIQMQAIGPLLAGRDLLGIAQTGTGKTAAFGLPLLQRLSENRQRPLPKTVRALILAPTRELAIQIEQSLQVYGRHLPLSRAAVYGGVGFQPQIKALGRGLDILVATPGRLMDLIRRNHVRLEMTQFLVLDEADRMLDMGFVQEVKRIVAMLPRQRQSLLFSATMPADIAELAKQMLIEPLRIEVTPAVVTVERIAQTLYFSEPAAKRDLLLKVLQDKALKRVLVFTRTKHGADRVAQHLERAGITADAIHGNKAQNARQRALEDFRDGKVRVLVATDIAARGIDVDGISHVINFELPNIPESYVHRIGRTARAGADGKAISFCSADERPFLRDIERLTKVKLALAEGGERSDGWSPTERQAPRQPARGGPRRDGGRPAGKPFHRGQGPARGAEPRANEGRAHEGRAHEGRAPEQRSHEPRREEAPRHEGHRHESHRPDNRSSRPHQGKPQGAKPAPARNEGPRNDGGSQRPQRAKGATSYGGLVAWLNER